MKKIIFLSFFVIIFCGLQISAQQLKTPSKPATKSNNTSSNTNSTSQRPSSYERDQMRRLEEQRMRDQEEAFNRLNRLELLERRTSDPRRIYNAKIAPLYDEPGKKDLKDLLPDKEYLQKYASFLKQDDTGIFKLIADQGCAEHTKVIVASPECMKYDFPGAGSSYSFRVENYRIPNLADITYTGRSIITKGEAIGSILVGLGNASIETVNLNTEGVAYLRDYKPPEDANVAFEDAKEFALGVKKDGFVYARGIFTYNNKTFILRSVAYRGKLLKAVDGVVYNELAFDKRRDIIVAFQIVGEHADGSITILWKELRNEKSPKLKFNDKESF